jgi:hypothetical protein
VFIGFPRRGCYHGFALWYRGRVAAGGAGEHHGQGRRLSLHDTRHQRDRAAHRQPLGTREAIEGLKVATIIEHSAIQVDDDVLNENGFTALDFDPTK